MCTFLERLQVVNVQLQLFFTDIKSAYAYYSVVRQLVVAFDPEEVLVWLLGRLDLAVEATAEVMAFVNQHGSLMQQGGAAPELIEFMQELNQDTWFVVDGSSVVARTG